MYPENIQELIEAAKELTDKLAPSNRDFDPKGIAEAWLRTKIAIAVLEAQEQPPLPVEMSNGPS